MSTETAAIAISEAASTAARDAFWDCLPDTYDHADMAFLACYLEEAALPAAAPLIVAEQLRSIAQTASDAARERHRSSNCARATRDSEHDGAFAVIDMLRDVADKLTASSARSDA